MALTPMPYLTIQEFDGDGAPLAGAKLFFYAAGTSTKQNTYTTAAGSVANANPVILDAAGRATVFFAPQTYDVVLAPASDTDPPTSPIWTRSGIQAVPATNADLDITGTAGEALSAGEPVYLSDGAGSLTAGRWYKTDADAVYSSSGVKEWGMAPSAIAVGASGSIRKQGRITGLSGLTAGTVYYASATAGALTATKPLNALAIGQADSTTSIVIPLSPIDMQSAYMTANVTVNNSATLVNATGLAFGVAAYASYHFTMTLFVQTNSTADLKISFTGPAAPTAFAAGIVSQGLVSTATGTYANALGQSLGVDGAIAMYFISGSIRNGATAGIVQLQFAQDTANASNTIISAESFVDAWRIS